MVRSDNAGCDWDSGHTPTEPELCSYQETRSCRASISYLVLILTAVSIAAIKQSSGDGGEGEGRGQQFTM